VSSVTEARPGAPGQPRAAARPPRWRFIRRIPRAARWCALVAFLNAAVWAGVTPIFHVPDETSHVAYLQYLAETGKVPNTPGGNGISDEEAGVMEQLRFNDVVGFRDELSLSSEAEQRNLDLVERNRPNPANGGGVIETSGQPPLYYALGSAIYLASPWKGLTQRVLLIRLLSALCAAATTLFVFMFLRELFAEPWTWTVGALAVAFQPMVGFMAGGVHPDNLFFAASAALLFGLARAFRRGLTPALGAGIGAALAVGVLSKINFYALLPGAVFALGMLVWRAHGRRGDAVRGAAVSLALLAVALGAYAVLNKTVWDRQALGGGVENAARALARFREKAVRAGFPGVHIDAELESIANAFGRLPPSTATDRDSVRERHRDKEVLRASLARSLLYLSSRMRSMRRSGSAAPHSS